jgi:hypothetical protein
MFIGSVDSPVVRWLSKTRVLYLFCLWSLKNEDICLPCKTDVRYNLRVASCF